MSLVSLSELVLVIMLSLLIVAGAADAAATRQMQFNQFRWVPLVRAARWAYVPASVLAALYLGLALAAAPFGSTLALYGALVLAIVAQARLLLLGDFRQALLRGILPTAILAVTSVNALGFELHPDSPPMLLSAGFVVVAALSAAGFWHVAHQRTQQDLLRLRD